MLINIFFFGVYCVVWWIDNAVSAIYKLKDTAETFKAKADDFNSGATLDNFKAASAALREAALALQEFGIAVEPLLKKLKCPATTGLASNTTAQAFQTAATNFANAAGSGQSGFQGVANELGTSAGQNTNNKLSTQTPYSSTGGDISFSDAKNKFNEAYNAFRGIVTALDSANCANLKNQASSFKDACGKFAIAAIAFNTKVQTAKSVKNSEQFANEKEQFDTGTGSGAAKEFYDAVIGLYDAIKDNLWPWS